MSHLAWGEKTAEHRAVNDVGHEGYGWSLPSVIEGEQPGWLEHGIEARTTPLRSHPPMSPREQRHYNDQGGEAMKGSEERAEPPRSQIEKRKRGRVDESKQLSVEQMDEEADDPRTVWILREHGAEHHGDVHARKAGELS